MKKRSFGICLFLLTFTILQAQEKGDVTLNVSSFNLRMDNPGDGENAWPHRKEMVKQLIQYHELDLIGTQEGFKHQLEGVLELGDFAYVGGGRDDGKDAGEHSAILYRISRLTLLNHGDFWFSETPDLPGKGWDATCCNRICSWAQFSDQRTGKTFFIFNVHYDHQGTEARRNSSLLLMEKVQEIAGSNTILVTGDFNATPDSEPIGIIREAGLLQDSYGVTQTPPYGTEGTFNAFRLDAPMKERIDYIWVTANITVKKYGVLNEQQYGRFPSDHFPVVIEAEL